MKKRHFSEHETYTACYNLTSADSLHAFRFVTVVQSLSRVRIFATPLDCSPPGSSVPGILQARTLEGAWLLCPPPGDLPEQQHPYSLIISFICYSPNKQDYRIHTKQGVWTTPRVSTMPSICLFFPSSTSPRMN